jgi:hypothetical protein
MWQYIQSCILLGPLQEAENTKKIAILYFSGGLQTTLQITKLEINRKVKIP